MQGPETPKPVRPRPSSPVPTLNLTTYETIASINRDVVRHRLLCGAKPFILLYDGVYYAYGTGAGSGIEVWTSRDLSTWERAKGNARDGLALHRTDVWGEKWFWAPEVYRLNDKFYMYFTSASPPPTRRWVLSYRRSGNR